MHRKICPMYLDYNATTPIDQRVVLVMEEVHCGPPANAGSRTHVYGQSAKDVVEKARVKVANVVGMSPDEVIFTSGATESSNLAILGLAAHGEATGRKHIISSRIEHKAVLEPLKFLASRGFEIEFSPVQAGGFVDPRDILSRCRDDTLLVSIMHANNETGILQDVSEIGRLLLNTKTYFHIDAAQTFGKESELAEVDFDLLSVSGHKIYGPQGIGALFIRRREGHRVPITAIIHGGGQERRLRSGTLAVPLVVGLGEACQIAVKEMVKRKTLASRVRLEFLSAINGIEYAINGDSNRSQSHVVNLRIPGIDSEALMLVLRDTIAISNGSACSSETYSPSHVLLAMGLSDDEAMQSVRISWGPGIEKIPAEIIVSVVESLQSGF